MIDRDDLIRRAREKAAELEAERAKPAYRKVLGALRHHGLLDAPLVPAKAAKLTIVDCLAVGIVEPRVLELLPSLVLGRPDLFTSVSRLPQDLEDAVSDLRKGRIPGTFRGLAGRLVAQHRDHVGARARPARLHSFRLKEDDEALLEELAVKLGLSRTDVLRRALRRLGAESFKAPSQ